MARSYDVVIAALTLDVPIKWIDNLLSRHRVAGVEHAAQGTTRRLSPAAMVRIRAIRILSTEIGIPVPQAVAITERLEASGPDGVGIGESEGVLRIDLEAVGRWIARRLPDAVESAPRRRRGRPVKR